MDVIKTIKEFDKLIKESIKYSFESAQYRNQINLAVISNKTFAIQWTLKQRDALPLAFRHCIFEECNFNRMTLDGKTFEFCEFDNCLFKETAMHYTTFVNCSFNRITFEDVKIHDSYIHFCCFNGITTKFKCCDFKDTIVTNSKLYVDKCTNLNIPQIVPESGSFIGYKRALVKDIYINDRLTRVDLPVIVKLLIPEDAKRISSTSRKCRCSKAHVLQIYAYDNTPFKIHNMIMYGVETSNGFLETTAEGVHLFEEAYSIARLDFRYKVGEIVEVENFDEECNECSSGIHFFITEKEALNFRFY